MFVKFIHKTLGGHVHVRVFVGMQQDHLSKAGDLVLTVDEFKLLRRFLEVMPQASTEHLRGIVNFKFQQEDDPVKSTLQAPQ